MKRNEKFEVIIHPATEEDFAGVDLRVTTLREVWVTLDELIDKLCALRNEQLAQESGPLVLESVMQGAGSYALLRFHVQE